MFAGLRFRHRIGLLVALAALGLVAVTAVTLMLGRRNEHQIAGIETRYVPLLELDRDLESLFTKITKALEDAASAAEDTRLDDADRHVAELTRRLEEGHVTIDDNGGDARALQRELAAYYQTARAVSAAMVGGAAASALADQIEVMRRAQLLFTAHLAAATRPDRHRLSEAFSSARRSQQEALWIDIGVAAGVLVLMALLWWQITRRMTRSLGAVSRGVERLARGEFGQEIEVATADEIGELAREANRTALRLREYRDQLEARNAELSRASNYKSEFLANMSHELRTPLNSIMILSGVLAKNEGKTLTAKQIEAATLINRSGEELLGLINEVLDLSKVEAGKQHIECAWIKMADLGDYMKRMFAPIAAQKHLELLVAVATDLPAQLRTDRTRLLQVVKNLLSNAFKFTERGAVRVRVFRPDAADYPTIRDPFAIAVADTGIGIAADKQAQIFDAFTQAERGTSRKYGGTGLGLTIARQLAERLGGQLEVESNLGRGSTFTLVLPLGGPESAALVEDAAPETTPARPESVTETDLVQTTSDRSGLLLANESESARPPDTDVVDAQLAGKTVLIVDDDMRNVYSLASTLRAKGIHVRTAADRRDVLDQLGRSPQVQVVLVDVANADGLATISNIRSEQRFCTLPVIALVTRAATDDREKSLKAGAIGYVAKPVDVEQLLALLHEAVKRLGDPES